MLNATRIKFEEEEEEENRQMQQESKLIPNWINLSLD